jgi:hypothetical protein
MDMAAKQPRTTITVRPDLSDYRGLLSALNKMNKQAKDGMKNDVSSISAWTASGIRQAGSRHSVYPRQASIIAASVRPVRDRLPTVNIGGGRGRVSGGANAGQLLFGNEFGGERNAFGNKTSFPNGGYRFPARSPREGRGNAGYWIFPTLKKMQPEIRKRWLKAVDKVMDDWAK